MDKPVLLGLLLMIFSLAQPEQDVWLLGLFPFSGPWAGGLGQLPAVQMGLEDVNRDPNILPGYTLHMTVNDTAVSELYFSFSSASEGK